MHSAALVEFLMAVGADWELHSWFYERLPRSEPPCDIETTAFNCDALHSLKRRILRTQIDRSTLNPATPVADIITENAEINTFLRQYIQSVRDERPVYYYVIAPIRYFGRLVGQSVAYRLFGPSETMNPRYRPARLALDIVGWSLQTSFLLLLPRGVRRSADRRGTILVACVVFYFYCVHPLAFRSNELRYVVPVLPLLAMLVASSVVAPRIPLREAADGHTFHEALQGLPTSPTPRATG
jgi:hypothetical protein